ncbi:hypothetical protein ACFP81_06690 [Deinococcus lacus]|uniref:Uncharacterized protein n=1 Tax=Deinococcus lacus TaxID=392561 RepID=A0ABW1YDV4_9DEIO
MKRALLTLLTLLAFPAAAQSSFPSPVPTLTLGGTPQPGWLNTAGDFTGLPVWTLPRLGLAVRNDPADLRLLYGTRELRYSPQAGWRSVGLAAAPARLQPPERWAAACMWA